MKKFCIICASVILLGMAPERSPDVSFSGILKPWRTVVLRASTGGIIEKVHCERGDFVKPGDIVATLEFRLEKADLEVAAAKAKGHANLDLAKMKLEYSRTLAKRNRALFKKGIINQEQLDDVVNQERVAEIRVKQEEEARFQAQLLHQRALTRYAEREIRTPIGGVVVERIRSAGEMVTRSLDSPIVRIAQMNPLAVDVRAPVEFLRTIKPGMKVAVTAESLEDRVIAGRVKTVDRVADAASGTFGFRIEIENTNNELPAGLRCQVSFETN